MRATDRTTNLECGEGPAGLRLVGGQRLKLIRIREALAGGQMRRCTASLLAAQRPPRFPLGQSATLVWPTRWLAHSQTDRSSRLKLGRGRWKHSAAPWC